MCAPAVTGATETSPARTSTSTADEAVEALAYDPQTAGGLLITLPADRGAVLAAAFTAVGLDLWRIGRVEAGTGVTLG